MVHSEIVAGALCRGVDVVFIFRLFCQVQRTRLSYISCLYTWLECTTLSPKLLPPPFPFSWIVFTFILLKGGSQLARLYLRFEACFSYYFFFSSK